MLWEFLTTAIKPIMDIIDGMTTSEDEKRALKIEAAKMEHQIADKLMELQKQLTAAQASIITAEAQGHSAIQRNWRPITMLSFVLLVIVDSFGWLPNPLAAEAWTLLQIGLGGYVVGRSGEKITKLIKK